MAEEAGIIQRLRDRGLITDAQFQTAIDYQRSTGGALREILVKLGFVAESQMNQFLADEAGLELVDVTRESIDHGTMSKLPRAVIEKHQVVPIEHDHEESKILLAMADPSDLEAIQEIQFLTNQPVEAVLAPKAEIKKAINQYFNLLSDEGRLVSVEDLLKMLLGKTPEVITAAILMALVRKGFLSLSEFRDELDRLR